MQRLHKRRLGHILGFCRIVDLRRTLGSSVNTILRIRIADAISSRGSYGKALCGASEGAISAIVVSLLLCPISDTRILVNVNVDRQVGISSNSNMSEREALKGTSGAGGFCSRWRQYAGCAGVSVEADSECAD